MLKSLLGKIPPVYIGAALFILIAAAYVLTTIRKHKEHYTSNPERTALFKRYSGVETLRNSKSKLLSAEVDKVLEQDGMPADIFVTDDAPSRNIAFTLRQCFEEYYKLDPPSPEEIEEGKQKPLPMNDMRKLWNASPVGEWDVNKAAMDSVADILTVMEGKRRTVRGMLEQDTTRFYYISSVSRAQWRTHIDSSASQYITDYALLEEFAAAKALSKGNISAAVETLAYMFRMAQLAAALESVGVRGDAATVRLRAFDVMQRIILDPQFEKKHLLYLRDMLAEQYDQWMPESETWFGDRAEGMRLFHNVLVAAPENVLEPEAIQFFESRNIPLTAFGKMETFTKRWIRQVPVGEESGTKHKEMEPLYKVDETFYLKMMQRVIDISKKPYCERIDELNAINKELMRKVDTREEPLLAHLLLKDVDRLMRFFACDQAALGRAFALMRRALGEPDTSGYIDPFTGKPYEIRKVNGLLTAPVMHLPRPFRVPDFTQDK